MRHAKADNLSSYLEELKEPDDDEEDEEAGNDTDEEGGISELDMNPEPEKTKRVQYFKILSSFGIASSFLHTEIRRDEHISWPKVNIKANPYSMSSRPERG